MQATLSFDVTKEATEFLAAVQSMNMRFALLDMEEEIFRPARKHGYSNQRTQELLSSCGDNGVELVGHLEALFRNILEKNSIAILE